MTKSKQSENSHGASKSIQILAMAFSFLLLIAPMFVFAQIENPLKSGETIPQLIKSLLVYVVEIGGIIATFSFIWAGFLYVKAQGNPTELETAKKVFINTCLGVAVLLGAEILSTIIVGTIKSVAN
jgi:hypothetical protein